MGTVGDLIANRYRLQHTLGHGTYGEVWKATDTHRHYAVALKLILNRNRQATWREAAILTALKSEHILGVNNADVFDDVPYIDTDLAECSLEVPTQPFGTEPGLAVDWMRRALRGLSLCHQRGLLHRDVKPQNIFLTTTGDAKLGDFGVAALMDQAGTADAHGDMRIRAPELFRTGRASIASDVYAAACTLYALVGGELPFAGHSLQADLENAVMHGDYTPIRDKSPHITRTLAERIKTGMALNPADRFSSAAAFDNALALPSQSRRFTPRAPHAEHLRCWTATGSAGALRICVLADTHPTRRVVETRHEASGNRVTQHCFNTTLGDLPKRLRAVFNCLR
ncbi:serine/threonine-protein kinase [Nocardia brasiliensis]|uniref:serine/threonine-protein kinase n=1 Tax=Nocardia brasiliensis TaxID=37326 RepID=UPI001E4F1DD2|nr:serine/threonine-protein kinase [Nocardia brasiliensis]